jgi:hypothetical protein
MLALQETLSSLIFSWRNSAISEQLRAPHSTAMKGDDEQVEEVVPRVLGARIGTLSNAAMVAGIAPANEFSQSAL